MNVSEVTEFEQTFFHTFEDGKISQQGRIIEEDMPGLFLVQFFEWIMGEPSSEQLIYVSDMKAWRWYASAEEMRDAYDLQAA
jgi:hypothetical protein